MRQKEKANEDKARMVENEGNDGAQHPSLPRHILTNLTKRTRLLGDSK